MNQSQNSPLSYGPDGGVSFKQRILRWLHGWSAVTGNRLASAIKRVPLIKGFIKFGRPWWKELGFSKHCIILDTLIRKLYVSDNSNLIWFYTDGESDLKAKAAIQSSKDFPLGLLSKHLKRGLPPNITVLDTGYKFWDSGISFVKVGANHIFDNAFIEAGPNLLVCSDIFTKYRGWVEGGIASAKVASEHLLLNRPFNSE